MKIREVMALFGALSEVSMAAEPTRRELTDPLAFLPRSRTASFRSGQRIFGEGEQNSALYLINSGAIKVAYLPGGPEKVVVRICGPEEFFGEAALLPALSSIEMAVALQPSTLMSWTAYETERAAHREPRLGFALIRSFTLHNLEFQQRIDELASLDIGGRLLNAVLRLFSRLALARSDGWIRMAPLTHEVLAQHIGTTRVIVTKYMTDFHRRGLWDYSRTCIKLHREQIDREFNQSTLEMRKSSNKRDVF